MVRVEERVTVAAPPQRVWEAVVDWEGQSRWMLLTTVRREAGPARGVGERLVAVTGVAGIAFTDPMEVVALEPPRRVVVRHLGRVVRGTGTFEVGPAPEGAWLAWAEDLALPLGWLGRLGFVAVKPLLRAGIRASLRRLARQLEAAG